MIPFNTYIEIQLGFFVSFIPIQLNKEILSTLGDDGCQPSQSSSEQFHHQNKSQQNNKADPSKCLFPTEKRSQLYPSEKKGLLPHPSGDHKNRQTGSLLPTPTSYEDISKIHHSYQEKKRGPNNGAAWGQSQGQNQKIKDYKKFQQKEEKTVPQNYSCGKKSSWPQQPSAQQTQQVPSNQRKEEMWQEEKSLKTKTRDCGAAKPSASNHMIGKSVLSDREDKQLAVTISDSSQQDLVPGSDDKDVEQRFKIGEPVQVKYFMFNVSNDNILRY